MTARYVRGMPNQGWLPDQPGIESILMEATSLEEAILAAGSNHVFLLRMGHPEAGEGYAVYKPMRGEAPLSDFPDGTLYRRERAAYVVSEALGWHLIPPTLVREDGLAVGIGALQLFIEHDPAENFFTLRERREAEMKRIAVFDWLTNNADRKGGHTLLALDGRLWCIDQGLTFHEEPKLRTVIWDYQGQPLPPDLVTDVAGLRESLQGSDPALRATMQGLIAMLIERCRQIEMVGVFPSPPAYRPYPWPMI
jgi:uncharacterized repeat protein (TIGR03843 family)